MTVIDQRAALRIQLACIAGKSRDGFYELRYALGGGRGMAQRFVPVAEPRSLLDAIARQARNSDVYIGAAPRRERRGTAGAIKHVWSLWVDCDGRAATNALERFLVRPTLVIRTGSGQNRHAWWAGQNRRRR